MLLGALPVVLAPPTALGVGDARPRQARRDAGAARGAAVPVRRRVAARGARRAACARVAAAALTEEQLADTPAGDAPLAAPRAQDLAFLQLTSGSTGTQRGVRITHGAVCANAAAIHDAIARAWGRDFLAESERVVSWLPLHHDMGLVGILLATIAGAFELTLMPPRAFLARPLTWLKALSGPTPVVSAAPNFAYHACVETLRDEDLAGLDLSGWHTALCGAEMVRPDTLARFAERFAPLGFDARALRPCYGLAEATLAVTFDVRDAGVRTAPVPGPARADVPREVACVGAPVRDTRVRIVGADGRELGEREVGRVHVAGPALFDGYWRDDAATAECLADGWLDTGDLGFLADGELHVTGREKDVLILRGHNVMPHELEWCAEEAGGGGGHARAGAFSVPGGPEGEVAVLAVETDAPPEQHAALTDAIRRAVADGLGLALHDLVLVRRGRLPKTTSGKVQRRELRRRYLAGELERLDDGTTMAPPR
ncbi:MAG: AMP-binding protein [Planctomycetes bacterium]|nr:AMP-binding protein [Planctomycetota bacterium]